MNSNLLPSVLTLQWSLLFTNRESFLILIFLRSVPLSSKDLLSLSSRRSFWRSNGVRSGFMYIGASSLFFELKMSSATLERRNLISKGLGRWLL